MAEHTPGPWENAGPIGRGSWIVSGKVQIAVTYSAAINPNAEADTRLIAAAPTLLAALEAVFANAQLFNHDSDACWMPIRDMARAAIAKAKGEPTP